MSDPVLEIRETRLIRSVVRGIRNFRIQREEKRGIFEKMQNVCLPEWDSSGWGDSTQVDAGAMPHKTVSHDSHPSM